MVVYWQLVTWILPKEIVFCYDKVLCQFAPYFTYIIMVCELDQPSLGSRKLLGVFFCVANNFRTTESVKYY